MGHDIFTTLTINKFTVISIMKIVNSNIPLRWVKPEIKRNKKIMCKIAKIAFVLIIIELNG